MGILWITYAWVDNEAGDFDFLVGKLAEVGVDARYDRRALIPGLRLWEQIANQILSAETDAWGILLTPASTASEPCREELAIALDRALRAREAFPLIGMLHNVGIQDIPAVLRTRLCVSLRDPNWPELVRAGVMQRPPDASPTQASGNNMVALRCPYEGDATVAALEYRPRFGEILDWVFILPEDTPVRAWGNGPANGGPVSSMRMVRSADVSMPGFKGKEYGGTQPITPAIAAYLIFDASELPLSVFVGVTAERGASGKWLRVEGHAITEVGGPR